MAKQEYINMWSGPRNVSTAIMYSFAQRGDTNVVDEPFYAHYLSQSGAGHPGREKVLSSQSTDPETVYRQLISESKSTDILFLKNMAHHMINMDTVLDKLISRFSHIFLIRDPGEMLPSLAQSIPNPTMRDTAYKRQFDLFSQVKNGDYPFAVIDSARLLKNPKEILQKLCYRLDIPFTKGMLSWEKGPIPEDGIWADHWYHSVHQSTGFNPYKPKEESIPDHLISLYETCRPYYSKMLAHAI